MGKANPRPDELREAWKHLCTSNDTIGHVHQASCWPSLEARATLLSNELQMNIDAGATASDVVRISIRILAGE
eukprot:14444523-Alexandrium_andersonii.AAC.1